MQRLSLKRLLAVIIIRTLIQNLCKSNCTMENKRFKLNRDNILHIAIRMFLLIHFTVKGFDACF